MKLRLRRFLHNTLKFEQQRLFGALKARGNNSISTRAQDNISEVK